jgi:hypothetical protein
MFHLKAYVILVYIFLSCHQAEQKNSVDDNDKVICTSNACSGTYKGHEFIKGSDVAHQFSNTISGIVGDQLKKLYREGNYSKVDF